jgi:hypothetical protein
MNTEYFEEQRRDMVAAVREITDHMAAQVGKTALDERVLTAMAKVPGAIECPATFTDIDQFRRLENTPFYRVGLNGSDA